MSTEQISPERAKPDLATLVRRLRGAAKHPYMNNTCPANIFDVADAAARIEALEAESERLAALLHECRELFTRCEAYDADAMDNLDTRCMHALDARAALPHP